MQFGPLAPDMNPRLNDGLLRVADGVYPSPDGYKPVGQWTQIYTTLGAEPKGGASFVSPQGVSSIIAGTPTALYFAFSGGWSVLATGYSVQGDQRWRFAQFGGLAIATNGADPVQKIDLATMTVAPLGGSPPKFETLGVVTDGFLVGTVLDGDILTLAWSAAYDAEKWSYGYDQSDYQTMAAGGRINMIYSGENGLLLQRDRISMMVYVGGNKVFDFIPLHENVGCVSPHSAVQWSRYGFFLSDQGFMQIVGEELTQIGRDWIDAEFAAAYDAGDWASMSTSIDPVRGVVMWSMGNKIYCYDFMRSAPGSRRWSTITYAAPIIFAGVTKGVSIDEDESGVANDSDIDGAGLDTLDSARFRGGDPRLYVFKSDYTLGVFTGTPMAATFTGKRANINFVRPEIDAASGVTVTLACKQTLAGAVTNFSTTTLQANGDMAIRASGRYNRPTVAVAAGTAWTHAKGLEYMGAPGGGR